MKKITINLSLTKAQWALLSLGIKYIVPLLPRMSWDELEEIDKLIDKKLEAVHTDEFVEKQLEEDYWCRGDDYQSLWTVHKDYVQEFLDYLKVNPNAISDNNKLEEDSKN